MHPQTLFILSTVYPFQGAEPFLEGELRVLAKSFRKVIIINSHVSTGIDKKPVYFMPDNAVVISIANKLTKPKTAATFKLLFNGKLWRELLFLITLKKQWPTKAILKVLVVSLYHAQQIAKELQNIKNQYPSESGVFYSYWCDEGAVALALLKEENPEIKAVSRAHGWDVYEERHQPAYLPLRKLILTKLDKLFYISEHAKSYTEKQFQYVDKNNKMQVAYLGVDAAVKMPPNGNNKALVVVSCSAVIALKRIDLIIAALAVTDIPVHWIHFGGGELFDFIQQKAVELLSPKANISFELRRDTSRNTILEYYANNQVDVFLNTSQFEGIPFSMMEALSYGIPIIGTDVGGVSELISDKYNGVLLSANPEPLEIATALGCIAQTTMEERQLLRKHAFETWETKFNAEKNYTMLAAQLLG